MRLGFLLGSLALSAVAACGFTPRPASGVVACTPQGAACCPDGYLCVGRGAIAERGPSAGACWYKEDLPVEALVLSHDHTPEVPDDPACLVTDWVPKPDGPYDSGVADEPILPGGEAIDAAVIEDALDLADAEGEG